MPDIQCYAFAEDELSCAILRSLIKYQNQQNTSGNVLCLNDGFPENKRGCGNLKKLIPAVTNMAKSGICTMILTDLDNANCTPQLIREWFGMPDTYPRIPSEIIFRVAEREIESWLLADRAQLASFLGIASANFASNPDSIPNPKQHLLNVLRSKGRRKIHKDMLPGKNAHVGPMYNPVLSEFVNSFWDPERASKHSQSSSRSLTALQRV